MNRLRFGGQGAGWVVGGVLGAVMILTGSAAALAITRCVHQTGTAVPPASCRTYTSIYTAQAESSPADEVRIYGEITANSPIALKARRLTGMVVKGVRSSVNAQDNPGVVIVVAGSMNGVTIKNLDIHTHRMGLATSVGFQLSQSGLVTLNGVRIIGPAGGQGIGIVSLPGTGHVRVFGNTGPSEISGLGIGMRAIRPASGLEINKVTVRDVTIGMESDSARISQWFNSTISCQRANSIGFRQIAVDGEDH